MMLAWMLIGAADMIALNIVLFVRERLFDWLALSRAWFERGLIAGFAASWTIALLRERDGGLWWVSLALCTGRMYFDQRSATQRSRLEKLLSTGYAVARVVLVMWTGLNVAACATALWLGAPDPMLFPPICFFAVFYIALSLPYPDDGPRGGKRIKALWKKFAGGFVGGAFPIPEGGPA